MSKYLVDSGRLTEGPETVLVCYFFFKDENVHTSDATKAIYTVLYQLFCQKRDLLRHALSHFQEKGSSFVSQFETLWNIFESAATDGSAGRIICIFDALDECMEDSRHPFIRKVAAFYRNYSANSFLKLIITSRPYDRIRDAFFAAGLDLEAVLLAGENDTERDEISKEVDLVVQSRVQTFRRLRKWKTKEEDDAHVLISKHLSAVSNRTYLWVSLIFPELEKHAATAKGDFAKILRGLPLTINSAYEKILSQSLDEARARKALHLILAATRPLFLDEMNIALTVVNGGQFELIPETSFAEYLRQLCGLFVHIIDEEVYLFHQSAKDFLLPESSKSMPKAVPGQWQHSFTPQDSNKVLALACIWYLQGIPPCPVDDQIIYKKDSI